MWLPVLDYADGYGFTYGARVSFVDVLGPRSRISVPLTWGGERKAALEVDRTFVRGPLTRVQGSVSLSRRENPHFLLSDTRRDVRVRAERALTSWLRVGGGARLTDVTFGDRDQRHLAPAVDVLVDTRTDPGFPRNAVHFSGTVEQLRFADGPNVARWTSDARGYVGLVGTSVLALRGITVRASESLPGYEQALLGGSSLLRGYEFGYRAGDNLAAVSAELRIPITSPLSVGRFGVKAFVDAGTVYGAGERLADQRLDRGVGGGVWVTATVVHAGLDVAWPQGGQRRKPRWHFGLGLAF
jgi:outer membrane protein assembly factor BamA